MRRAVRAFQVWLVADDAGNILSSSPTRAEIEAEKVDQKIEVWFESTQTLAQLAAALDEVPEIAVTELVAVSADAA